MKRILALLLVIPTVISAQGSGTPSTLRVLTDSNGYLVVANATQTLPLTQSVFSNTRLKTDASGYLQVVMTGTVTPTFPLLAPTQADCSVVSYAFTGRTTTGLNSHAANTWNLCGGGTLGLSGNTTAVTAALPFGIPDGLVTSPGLIFSGGDRQGFYRSGTTTILTEGGNSLVNFTNAGSINLNFGNVQVPAGQQFIFNGRGSIRASADGVLNLFNAAGSDFSRLTLGGTTSSFPAIKRLGTAISFRLADDSADASIFVLNNNLAAAGIIQFSGRSAVTSASDGTLLISNNAQTDFSRLQFGGTTSSFPALRRTNTFIDILLADASNFSEVRAAGFNLQSGTGSGLNINTIPIISVTDPTIASGGCTSPTITTITGTNRFRINIGTSCTGVKTVTLTLPATTTSWTCNGDNNTSDAAQQTNYIVARSTSTTAVVVTSYDRVTGLQEDFTASDTYLMSCR